MKALVSIHDLMPGTMDRVEAILAWLSERSVPPVTLLVVPGKPWTPEQIDRLRAWAAIGHPLAAHGWHHHTEPRRLKHRLHAALISRNVAEHLALDSKGILDLMLRGREWFLRHRLPDPTLYVPPAWALGPLNIRDQAAVPYRMIETTRGLLFPNGAPRPHLEKLPLSGYEADTPLRERFLRAWNALQARSARRRDAPLRISIHPHDLHLRIPDQLDGQLREVREFLDYDAVAATLNPPAKRC
ncbi:MAG: polysaccharide deacetylase family protein [Verrucomicrobiota bacterium]